MTEVSMMHRYTEDLHYLPLFIYTFNLTYLNIYPYLYPHTSPADLGTLLLIVHKTQNLIWDTRSNFGMPDRIPTLTH